MRKYTKHMAVLLAICTCVMLFTACGAPSLEEIAEEIAEKAKESESFDISYSFDALGSIDSAGVELSGRYTRQQSETSGDIYEDIYNTAKIGEAYGREYLTMFRIDDSYYYEDDATYICEEAIVDFQTVPGKNFWPIFISAEKQQVDEDDFSCTVVLAGDDLRETLKEFCYNIYTEVAPYADWSQIQGEIEADLSDAGYVEKMCISCPALGEIMMQTVDPSAAVSCTDFDIEIFISYYDPSVITPDGMDSAISTEPIAEYGMNSLLRFMMGENEEMEEIAREQEEAANFEPVTLDGEGSITFRAAGKTVVFDFPAGISMYDTVKQTEPGLAILTHDIFGDVTGRTIIQFQRGTAESFFHSLNLDIGAAQDVSVNGVEGKLIVERVEEVNSFGKNICSEDFFFAAEMEDVVLGFRIETVYDQADAGIIDESIVSDLLGYCTIG